VNTPVFIGVEGSGAVSERYLVATDDGTLVLQPEGTVLVVDPDGVTRRYVELALRAVRGARVVTAASGAEALEALVRAPVDAVIAASRLGDGEGLELRRRMAHDPRVARVPFLVLSADQRPGAKVAAFVAGVDDYLVKPCDGAELGARVLSAIARSRRCRTSAAPRPRQTSLAGDFETLPLPDLVAALELGGHTGKMAITTGRAAATLTVDRGRVVHARFAGLTGVEAFARLLDEPRGTFELVPGGVEASDERSIGLSTTALLLESARLNDERHAHGSEAPGVAHATLSAGVVRQLPAPDKARHFEYGLTDGWSPGELSVLDGPELGRWTRDAGARERFHVHLVTDLAVGVATLFSLAAPPGPGPLCGALRGEPSAAVLTAWLRAERMLDVVLLDVTHPAALHDSLVRTPALVIVAPPDGDPQALSPRARAGLAALAATLAPPLILGVGGRELEDYLAAFQADDGPTVVRTLRGGLGEDLDLRRVLVEGLRLYGLTGGAARWTWV
jgi:DNA-binding response OmpR family regulator